MTPGRFDPAALDDIRAREPLSALFERFGHRPRRAGPDHVVLCPFHNERTPSCTISDRKAVYHCKGCSAQGDAFSAVMAWRSCTFPEAVEYLGGARELTEFDRARLEKRRRDIEIEEEAARQRATLSVERAWNETRPRRGTHADAYLQARGLYLAAGDAPDLRFLPALPYRGFASTEAEEATDLGTFPTMVAAIRSSTGALIGLHRTYLDPVQPRKLRPPGDAARNAAKKVLGRQRGGSIALSTPRPVMAYGEGIETTLSWHALGGAGDEPCGLATTVSLGNMCGSALGSIPHPSKAHEDGRPVVIPDGRPDPERPGFVPPDDVERCILIGDGDGDAPGTRMRLLTAARRYGANGRPVQISMAVEGFDFNDLLLRDLGEAAA